jgi:hypothetical protein
LKHVFYHDPFHQDLPQAGGYYGITQAGFPYVGRPHTILQYLTGGVSAGTIAAFGTIDPGGTLQYLYAPQVHHDLEGDPVGFVGNSSNKIDKFSCVYIRLSDFKFFPFVEAKSTMNELLKHTQVTPFASEHLTYTCHRPW